MRHITNRFAPHLLFGLAILVFVILIFVRRTDIHGTVDRFSMDGVELVTMIILQDSVQKLTLTRQESGAWLLNNQQPADGVAVKNLLSVLRNAVVERPVSTLQKEEINNLLNNHGVRVEVFRQSYWINLPGVIEVIPRKKRMHGFYIASSSEDRTTSYARLLRSEDPYEIHIPGSGSVLSQRFVTDTLAWKDPVVLSLRPAHIKQVRVYDRMIERESFELTIRDHGIVHMKRSDGTVIEQELINKRKMDLFLRSFFGLFYEKLLSEREIMEYQLLMSGQPFMQIEVVDTSGNLTSLAFFRVDVSHASTLLPIYSDYDPNRFILLVNGDTYALAQYLVFNRIMRPLGYFLIYDPDGAL